MKKIGPLSCDILIVDELHTMMTLNKINAHFLISPKMILSLSATPFRYDDFDKCIKLFYGENIIEYYRKIKHIVYSFQTYFIIPNKIQQKTGKIDWNFVIDFQSKIKERNELIVEIISSLKKKWIVFVKRIEQADKLEEMLKKKNLTVEKMIKTKTKCEEVDVVIGICNKIKQGFDYPSANALFLRVILKIIINNFLEEEQEVIKLLPL